MAKPLSLVVLLIVEELPSGDVLAWPFADPDKVAHGTSRASALEKQELFLREFLAKTHGGTLAAYDPDAAVDLQLVEVELQRDDLPEQARILHPLVFPCMIVPDGADTWAVVLNLHHAVWIAGGLDDPALREAKIRGEIERVIAARELSPSAFLQLLRGADPFSLERLTIEVDREELSGAEARAAARRRRAKERSQAEATQLLARVGTSLIEEIRLRRQPPVLHREREIASLDALLRGPERLALTLVGPELAGKTAVVHGLVNSWLEGPGSTRSKGRLATLPTIVATSGAQLVAGQSGFGQLEQRVADVMAAAELLDAVLYFDNLGDLFARTSGELGDVASSMRPWLERGRVRLLGEITPDLLEHHEKRHVGFFSYLNRIAVPALDAGQTRDILAARAKHDRRVDPDRPTLSLPPRRDAATPLVDLAERYFSYQAFPGKALRFYASLRATQEGELTEAAEPRPIGPDEVYRGFSIHSGIPMFLLREDRALDYDRIVAEFASRVIGQREAIRRVAETLCTVKAGLQPGQKPLATFLFVGPTGVGKTEVAKTLARFLFGSPERMLRFDMSEYMDPLAAERLIRGSDRDDGVLTRKVRQQPFCVVLLDEIEKAHPAVFDLLLQVCGEGRLSDARGRTTWFHNAIIIMTSNLGAAHRRPQTGFGASAQADAGSEASAAERYYLDQVNTHFRPEFVNRIDRVIPFHPLDRAQIQEVAQVSLVRVRERDGIRGRGINLELDEAVLDRLAREGYSDTYGARALRRELEDRLVAPLARTLAKLGDRGAGGTVDITEAASALGGSAKSRTPKGTRVLADEVQDELAITVAVPAGRVARRTLDALGRVSTLRRSAAAALELAPVRELRDRMRVLVADLGYGAHKRKDERSAWEHSAELGRLQAEHGRIAGTVARIDELMGDLHDAEELTIAAVYEGEDAELYQAAAETAHTQLQQAIVDALLLENERHSITVHLQEQDSRGAFLPYLLPLLDTLVDRGWSAHFHVYSDKGKPERGKWPADRPWGPSRSPEWLRRRLLAELEAPQPGQEPAPKRKFRDVLMCLKGRHAGAVVDSQLGLFRYDSPWLHAGKRSEDDKPGHLLVRFVARQAAIETAEWDKDHLKVEKPLTRKQLDSTAKRAHFDDQGQLSGTITPERRPMTPTEFWPRIEAVMFTSLVTRAFRGSADASSD